MLVAFTVVPLSFLEALAAQPPEQSSTNANPAKQPTAQASSPKSGTPERVLPEADLIDFLMKRDFKVIESPPNGNPFPILVPRSSKEKEASAKVSRYKVLKVRPFQDKWFFRRQKVFLVIIDKLYLERRIMSGNRSNGLFALDGNKLIYLNGADSALKVSKVLRRENRPLSDADPEMLAILFATTILRQNNDRVDVVQSPDELSKQDRPNAPMINKRLKEKGSERTYATTLEKGEFEKCKDKLFKPQLSYDPKSGWLCKFVGMRGFLHTIRTPFALVEYHIFVSPNFDIKVEERVLSDRILT